MFMACNTLQFSGEFVDYSTSRVHSSCPLHTSLALSPTTLLSPSNTPSSSRPQGLCTCPHPRCLGKLPRICGAAASFSSYITQLKGHLLREAFSGFYLNQALNLMSDPHSPSHQPALLFCGALHTISPFNKYLLSTYYMPTIVVGTFATRVNKAMILAFIELTFSWQRQKMYTTHVDHSLVYSKESRAVENKED